MLYYILAFAVAAAGGLFQLNRKNEEQKHFESKLCPCFCKWKSLDDRWTFLHESCQKLSFELTWFNLSRACGAVGGVIGWIFGLPFLRVPLDVLYFDRMASNNAQHGCIQEPYVCTPVQIISPDNVMTTVVEKWCPTRVHHQCELLKQPVYQYRRD